MSSSPSRSPALRLIGGALLFLLASVALAGSPPGKAADIATATPLPADFAARTDALVRAYRDLDIFSGVVLVARDGKPVYRKAFGFANRDLGTPVATDTRFAIGSMNKTFTHILILQLIAEGKLSFDSRMTEFLDGFTQKGADRITVRQLLDHRSGFGDYHDPDYFDAPPEARTISGLLPRLRGMPLLFEPGTDNQYSNAGYVLLGAIIEKVTGKPFADNVDERIAEPLKLRSLATHDVKHASRRAIGYTLGIDGIQDNERFIGEPLPDGGFFADADDVLTLYREFFFGHRLLDPAIKARDSFFPRIQPILREKGRAIPLAGGFNGANTVCMMMLADGISIVVLANMNEPVAEKLADGIFRIVSGQMPPAPALPAQVSVYRAFNAHGADYIREHFAELTRNWTEQDPRDLILNGLGYDLLFGGRIEPALAFFRLNTELFPDVANVWDSYGEALLKHGDRLASLAAYRKALAIDPELPTAQKAVKDMDQADAAMPAGTAH